MPFGLIKLRETFQQAIKIAFHGLINEFVVIYLYDVTVCSKRRFDHLSRLGNVFESCRKFCISLNPKMSIFVVTTGKLLGCDVSKNWIMIDYERTQAIDSLSPPTYKSIMW